MGKTPTNERTTKWLRERGYEVANVEQRVPRFAGKQFDSFSKKQMPVFFLMRSRDLFNLFDFLAVGDSFVGVQTTSTSNHAKRRARFWEPEAIPLVLRWLTAGGKILVLSWRKKPAAPGSKLHRYYERVEWIEINDDGQLVARKEIAPHEEARRTAAAAPRAPRQRSLITFA